jgi:basic amino acid/polyamine antiporter, APA family
LIGSLGVCTIYYLLVSYSAIGSIGAQPIMGPNGVALQPGTPEMAAACSASEALVCSKEALAHVMRVLNHNQLGTLIGLAAGIALPSVILTMTYGQTRIFFTMARDGLLPASLSKIHPRFHTPHVITLITGIFVSIFGALYPVGQLADITNSGTLFAFMMVAVGVMVLRVTQPDRKRPFRTPLVWVVCPLAVFGCLLLFINLPLKTLEVFFGWGIVGLVVYYLYGHRKSHLANGTEPT